MQQPKRKRDNFSRVVGVHVGAVVGAGAAVSLLELKIDDAAHADADRDAAVVAGSRPWTSCRALTLCKLPSVV